MTDEWRGGKEAMEERATRSALPSVKVDFSECSSSSAAFVRSTGIDPDCAAEIEGVRQPVDNGFEFTAVEVSSPRGEGFMRAGSDGVREGCDQQGEDPKIGMRHTNRRDGERT